MALPPTRTSGPYLRPTRLGNWEVIAKIAGGGMSAIYLGRRAEPAPEIPNVVALKIMRHDVRLEPAYRQMFVAEGRLIARLVHPNIVRTHEVGSDAEQAYIAMELMLGKTFASIHDAVAAQGARLSPAIAAWVAARVADALDYAHELTDESGAELALVHRDVNPANVFATFDGRVKLFDFGLAKVTAGERKGSQLVAGKLSYLSPEQIMQMPIDRRSDVFSLGTTLWELLTGKRLFRRDTDVETVRAVQLGPIPDPREVAPEIPQELARITRTALERNREHRYPTAAHLAHDLDAFALACASKDEVASQLARLVDALFPGEQKRQSGWLKPAISSSRTPGAPAVTPRDGVPSSRPQSVRPQSSATRVSFSAPPSSIPPAPPSTRPRPSPSVAPRRASIPLPSTLRLDPAARSDRPSKPSSTDLPPDSDPTDVDIPVTKRS